MKVAINRRKTMEEHIIIEAESIPDAKRNQKNGVYDHLWKGSSVSEITEFYTYHESFPDYQLCEVSDEK